jgi:hypothetical protein
MMQESWTCLGKYDIVRTRKTEIQQRKRPGSDPVGIEYRVLACVLTAMGLGVFELSRRYQATCLIDRYLHQT